VIQLIGEGDRRWAERVEAELRAARELIGSVAAFLDAAHFTPRFQTAYDELVEAKHAYDEAGS
jgi:non-homologous end joining protein Ku